MSLGLATSLIQMPTVRQLLEQILDDLRSGRSVLGLLPEGVDPSLLRSDLLDSLEHWDLHSHEVFIPQLDTQMLAAALGQTLGIDWGTSTAPRTVENLLRQADLPEILFLDGFDELAEEDRVKWLRFMVQWAEVCQGRHSTDEDGTKILPVLCLLAEASKVPPPPPQTNVLLTVRVWWGIPTTLEMRLLCQLASEQDSAPLSRWKEHVIPAIAGSDLCLGDYLWVQEYSTGAELAHVLRAFAEERGWTKAELETWSMDGPLQEGTSGLEGWPLPSPLYQAPLYQVWARGMVHWTLEHGLERHSAVLAQLYRQEALDHRLWRGQAGLLLPQIDEARLALCAHLNQAYGQDWPHKWQEPESDTECQAVRDTPFACQWGHLEFLLRKCPDFERERRWIRLARWSRQIRNNLAHYRPISLNDYERFCQEVKHGYQAGLMTA